MCECNLNNAWGQSKRSGKMFEDHQQNSSVSTAFSDVHFSSHTLKQAFPKVFLLLLTGD